MPRFDYEHSTPNENCQDELLDIWQKITDPKLDACPTCGEPVNRLIGLTSFSFKGGPPTPR